MQKKLRQLKQPELKKIRRYLHKKQGGVCPILNQPFPLSEMVVDHQHMTKAENVGIDGAGLVRGVIQRQANVIEGKLTNAYRRYGLHKYDITLSDFLRNLAAYLEQHNLPYIHPNEKPKAPKLKKASYNKLRKLVGDDIKIPDYPKSQKMTAGLEKLFISHNLAPEYYRSG